MLINAIQKPGQKGIVLKLPRMPGKLVAEVPIGCVDQGNGAAEPSNLLSRNLRGRATMDARHQQLHSKEKSKFPDLLGA